VELEPDMSDRLHNCPTCTCHVAPEHRREYAVNPDAPLYWVVMLFDDLLAPHYAEARARRRHAAQQRAMVGSTTKGTKVAAHERP
jgi:hypothetical protein